MGWLAEASPVAERLLRLLRDGQGGQEGVGQGPLAMSSEAQGGSPEEETPRSSAHWPRKAARKSWGGDKV